MGGGSVTGYRVDLAPELYDLILDVASNLSLRACKSSLTSNGVYLVIGRARGRIIIVP